MFVAEHLRSVGHATFQSGVASHFRRLKRSLLDGHYFSVLTFGVVIVYMVYGSFPEDSSLRQDDHVWDELDAIPLLLLGFVAAIGVLCVIAWSKLNLQIRPSRAFRVGVLFLLLAWGGAAGLSLWREEVLSPLALAVPTVLLMIAFRPPATRDVLTAARIWVFTVVVGVWVYWGFESVGFVDGFDVNYRSRYPTWIGLEDFLPSRWDGPFRGFGDAGITGAITAAYGLHNGGLSATSRTALARVWLTATGLILVVLSNSRIAFGALALMLLVTLIIKSRWIGGGNRAMAGFYLVLFLGMLSALLAWFLVSGGNGRTGYWSRYLEALWLNPFMGLGYEGINSHVLTQNTGHAHNFLLDAAARYGIFVATAVILGMILLGLALSLRIRDVPNFFWPLLVGTLVSMTVDIGPEMLYLRLESIPALILIGMTGTRGPKAC
jgi:hypothetical protein